MKKAIIIILITLSMCGISQVYAAPQLNISQDDCRDCHGDTVDIHHEFIYLIVCEDCHGITPGAPGWRLCLNCHAGFDHHVGAAGNCSTCHDDKQFQGGNSQSGASHVSGDFKTDGSNGNSGGKNQHRKGK